MLPLTMILIPFYWFVAVAAASGGPTTTTTTSALYEIIPRVTNGSRINTDASISSSSSSSIIAFQSPLNQQYRNLEEKEDEITTTTTISPNLISFDGDLDAVTQLALDRANNNRNNNDTSDGTNTSGGSSYFCKDAISSHLEIVTWVYAMETVPAATIPLVYGEISEITLKVIVNQTLSCQLESVAYATIVGMDANITSAPSPTQLCTSQLDPAHVCTVIEGRMRLFLSDSTQVDEATAIVLQQIELAYSNLSFVQQVGSGLMRIEYIAPPDTNPTPLPPPPIEGDDDQKKENNDTNDQDQSSENLGPTLTSLLFVAAGSATLIIFVGSVLLVKRHRGRDQRDGMMTQFAGSTLNGLSNSNDDDEENGPQPSSPFSQMIPGSYNLGDNTSILSTANMSPVYEVEDDSVVDSASVVVSESGYSTEAGRSDSGLGDTIQYGRFMAKSYHLGGGGSCSGGSSSMTPEYLGAMPRPGMTLKMDDMEAPTDSDLDTSGENYSPVKMFRMDPMVSSSSSTATNRSTSGGSTNTGAATIGSGMMHQRLLTKLDMEVSGSHTSKHEENDDDDDDDDVLLFEQNPPEVQATFSSVSDLYTLGSTSLEDQYPPPSSMDNADRVRDAAP